MEYQVQSYHRPLCLEIKIQGHGEVAALGLDNSKPNTKYFFRKMPLEGVKTFEFNLSQTPKTLDVAIFPLSNSFSNETAFKVLDVKILPHKSIPLFTDKLTSDFIKFAEKFCEQAGYLEPGDYVDSKNQFHIQYMPAIKNGNTVLHTPARIHKIKNNIQISKKDFNEMTIPARKIIIYHEFSHNYLNDRMDSEIESDINALNIYLSKGDPYIEAVYAFTRIFQDSNENNKRIRYIDDFLKRHNTERRMGYDT